MRWALGIIVVKHRPQTIPISEIADALSGTRRRSPGIAYLVPADRLSFHLAGAADLAGSGASSAIPNVLGVRG